MTDYRRPHGTVRMTRGFAPTSTFRPPSHHHDGEYDDYAQYWLDHPDDFDDYDDYEPELEDPAWEDLGS